MKSKVVVQKVLEKANDFGFITLILKYEDLYVSGVIGATKVTQIALQSAALIAGIFLTMEVQL